MFLQINPPRRSIDVFDNDIFRVGVIIKKTGGWVFCRGDYYRDLTDSEMDELANHLANLNARTIKHVQVAL